MEWQIVKVNETKGRSVPFASIGRGRIEFSAAACDLVHDKGDYKYAQILKGKENGKTVIGVKFYEEYTDECIRIKRKTSSGVEIKGMTVANKGVIEELFGKDGSNDGMVRYKVELVDDNILKILD